MYALTNLCLKLDFLRNVFYSTVFHLLLKEDKKNIYNEFIINFRNTRYLKYANIFFKFSYHIKKKSHYNYFIPS